MIIHSKHVQRTPLWLTALCVFTLSACSGESGQDTTPGVAPPTPTTVDKGITYNGPTPNTQDVQNFKRNIWDNLATEDRCGACHTDDGQGSDYPFVRLDDINKAYESANTLVDLSAPELSRLAVKVGEGHNCWRPELEACADTVTRFITAWATESGAEISEVVLTAPPVREVVDSKSFPDDSSLFASTVYPVLEQNCAGCHSEQGSPQQRPYFASRDIEVAYESVKSKINLDDPSSSRLLQRVRDEGHNCWENPNNAAQDSCFYSSGIMLSALNDFTSGIALTEVNPDLVTSNALRLDLEGVVASSGGRYDTDAIALYQFKEGEGSSQALDTSGVEPAMDLTLFGNYNWEGNWGVTFDGGKAQAPTSSSSKLHSVLTKTGEYSVEAWVVPANVTQEGPARIVTYSGDEENTNFILGQTLYNYDFLTRSENLGANGMPGISTPNADEVLQATLQHVVVNFNLLTGRKIFVNGELISEDTNPPGNLNDWDDTFALAVGSEVNNQRPWRGTLRFLAIHSRELTPEQISTNYDSGVGEKFFMLFGISHLIDVPQAYIVFEAQQFDSYSYLFTKPYFLSLDSNANINSSINIKGMRLGVNGKEVEIGQAFANIDVNITRDNYTPTGTPISPLGALVELEKGASEDDFFLTFDSIGSNSFTRDNSVVIPLPVQANEPEQSDIGLRNFGEINATLSAYTGVNSATPNISALYERVRQQLPISENIEGFLAAHQAGVMQLSVGYCTALVTNAPARDAYFSGFDFSGSITDANRDLIINPLLRGLSAAPVDNNTVEIQTQPTSSALKTHLYQLLGEMSSANTQTATIALCAAAGGSAVMLLQ